MPRCIGSVVWASPHKFLARDRRSSCRISAKLGIEGKSGFAEPSDLASTAGAWQYTQYDSYKRPARPTEDTEMSRLALAAATATAPTYAAEIPVLVHQRLKDGAARNKATLTFAEKRVLVLGIGRRHASRKTKSRGISPLASLFVTGVAYRLPWRRSGA